MYVNLRGQPFEVHNDEALSNHIKRENDFFEAEILDYLATHHNKQRVVIDVGANIGNHSVYFARFLDYGFIVSMEPMPENYALLRRNMEPYNYIALIQCAASDHTGDAKMFLNSVNYGASFIDTEGPVEVKTLTIDRMMLSDVTLIKIDVEGHEPQVIEGANETIARNQPIILIEDWEQSYSELLPDNYELYHAWDKHHTYLFGPK